MMMMMPANRPVKFLKLCVRVCVRVRVCHSWCLKPELGSLSLIFALPPSHNSTSSSFFVNWSIYDINKEKDHVNNSRCLCDELKPPLHSVLENNNRRILSEDIFQTVSLSSDSLFQRAVSILHTSYLDSASEHGFQYSHVTFVKNDFFLNEYKAFYQQKQTSNYTEEELQETYGFFLLETENQAKLICQRGLCVGSSTVTTLGDPAKGVYVSKYSDYLHPRPWYHGKSGYIVIFNIIKGKVKFVSENYTVNYTRPSSGYDCHVAKHANKVSDKTSHFRAFELSQCYFYELSGNTIISRPRQICPFLIVAFQYREPKTMAAPTYESIFELCLDAPISPWKGKLIVQGCVLCDITLRSTYSTMIPSQLPRELDFKYIMKVSSLKEKLPEAAFRKQNYLEQKVCCQDLCFDLYEVELSNKQGDNLDKLIEYIKSKQLAIVKCLEDREVFVLLTSSALIPAPDFEEEQMGIYGLHLFHSPLSTVGVKDWKVGDDLSSKVIPIIPALNCALLEAKKSLLEERTHPNTLVQCSLQARSRADSSLSLMAVPQDGVKETGSFGKLPIDFDLIPPPEKCPLESFIQLKSYISDSSGYSLDVSTAQDLLAERPQTPFLSDGICDAGFSLVMTPDPEFLDSEAEVKKETEKENSATMLDTKNSGALGAVNPPESNLRAQSKRKVNIPLVQSKRMNLCHPLPKRTASETDNGVHSPTTLKLVKGEFPQKKRGAEVLTAQFVQTTKLNETNQEVTIFKHIPVAVDVKRAKKQEKSPVKTKPRVSKSPQKQMVNIVKDKRNSTIRKQPQPAKRETSLQLQSEISPDGQKDGISINTAQPECTSIAPKDLPQNSSSICDSQALNMLADLALSCAASSIPSYDPRNLSFSTELLQNDVSLSKENLLYCTSDHEYHRGVKSQKGVLLPKPSSDRRDHSESDITINQEENLGAGSQDPAKAQSALPEEALPTSATSQNLNAFVAVEHSYALLLPDYSKKHLHQRGLPGPTFAKNGTKGPEAGTPVGKVIPFRHLQNISPLQKFPDDSLIKRRSRFVTSNLKDTCSHTVSNCDGSLKVTFICDTEYKFSLDSKYTNNPLEKTILRALHGPSLLLSCDQGHELLRLPCTAHRGTILSCRFWCHLGNQNKVVPSSRKVVEHSNPAKYVSINSTLDFFNLSEMEEISSVEKCSLDPLLETKETSGSPAKASFPSSNCVLPFVASPSVRHVGLGVQNEEKEELARECRLGTSESQNSICSCNNELSGEKAKEELSDKPKTSSLVLSGTISKQTNRPSISGEAKTFQPLENTGLASYSDTVTQATLPRTYDGSSSQAVVCQKVSVYSALKSKGAHFPRTMQTETGAIPDLSQQSSLINSECQPSLQRVDDENTECEVISVEPLTLTFGKNACEQIHTEVNIANNPPAFNTGLMKQISPTVNSKHPIISLENAQTQGPQETVLLTGQLGTKYLSASSISEEMVADKMCSDQKEIAPAVSSPPAEKPSVMESLSLVDSSRYPVANDIIHHSQAVCVQTPNLLSISSEEIIEPPQVEVASLSPSATPGNYSLNCIPPESTTLDGSLELRNDDRSNLNCENTNLESFNLVHDKQTSLSMNREEVGTELSVEGSDIDLTLTVLPPSSPREEIPAGRVEELQESQLQSRTKEIVRSNEKATLIENREVNLARDTLVHPTKSEESLGNEKIDSSHPVTLIFSKESCALEFVKEMSVTSTIPFDSLIEEVSPASSPGLPVSSEEIRPSQTVSPYSSKVGGTQYERSNKFSPIKVGDLPVTEKENCFVYSTYPVGKDDLTEIEQIQLSAKMPLMLANRPDTQSRPILPGKASAGIVGGHGEGLAFSEKVQHCGVELSKSASIAKCEGDFKPSLEKLAKPGNPLQPVRLENRNLDLKHLHLESSKPPLSPRNMIENKSLADTLVSKTDLSGIVNTPLKQTSPESIIKNIYGCDLKIDADSYIQVKSTNSASIDGADVTQAYMHPEFPKLDFLSDGASRPPSVASSYQTQEISVVRMAHLLNGETDVLYDRSTGLGAVSLHSCPCTKGEQKTHVLQGTLPYEMKEQWDGEGFPVCAGSDQDTANTSDSVDKDSSDSLASESFDPDPCIVSEEQMVRKNTSGRHGVNTGSETLVRDTEMSVNTNRHCEPLSGNLDEDTLDFRNPKFDKENLGPLRGSRDSKKEDAAKDNYDSFMNLNKRHNEAWGYSNNKDVSRLETSIPPRNWAQGLKTDKYMTSYVHIPDSQGVLRTYANFTVTREVESERKTSLKSHPRSADANLLSSWTWHAAKDLTQSTLDIEYLRFAHEVKAVAKDRCPRKSALESNSIFWKESSTPVGAFPSTKVSENSVFHPESRSPLVVTVVQSSSRQQNPPKSKLSPSDVHSSSSVWKEKCLSRNLTNTERNQTVPFHLNRLSCTSTLKDSQNDISLILNEFAEFDKVMIDSSQVFQDGDVSVTSEEATSQRMCPSFPRLPVSYRNLITDFCDNLHVKLKSVTQEASEGPFWFYLVETEDKSFFLQTKSVLKKGGHREVEPQHFCKAFGRKNDMLIVIIRNEDIASHLHQIPSLLKMKHFPNITFAGVDSPKDVLSDSYQELFRTGGFVVSDDKMLEALTLAQLKEIIRILETLNGNGNGRWKWLLHYRENKKLRESARVDPIAYRKNLILKSYQSANIIELLHYHQCDSQSSTEAENLKCLINLQIQHINARFGVFLVDKPTFAASTQVFENSGILVTDINYFIENIQGLAAPFRSSYW
ncbi:protein TASOR 2 [Perognathus longimembris pacificus]|uniref:protein TASOR 2 n=1 Tax=Perognathus longimembris pacificus TaxID=214514 RepID=UPI002019F7AB|nr:protein TASOR 2 [Perognathus longimembris pacificus]